MSSISKIALLEKHKEYGVIFIRLIIGFHLIYGTQDNVFSYARMEEFASFLSARGVPFPLFSAFLSAYAQFICGALFLIGAATRYAAVAMRNRLRPSNRRRDDVTPGDARVLDQSFDAFARRGD